MDTAYHMLEITPHREARQCFWLERGEGGWFKIAQQEVERLGRLSPIFKEAEKLPTKNLLELAEKMGLSRATTHRELSKLIDEGFLVKQERGIYSLPNREDIKEN